MLPEYLFLDSFGGDLRCFFHNSGFLTHFIGRIHGVVAEPSAYPANIFAKIWEKPGTGQ
jgi:hypothetical protein